MSSIDDSSSSSWMQQDQATKGFLSRFRCGDIMAGDQRLVYADEHTTVEQGMRLMNKHNLLSLPVWNAAGKEFVGMVNIYDIVLALSTLPGDQWQQIIQQQEQPQEQQQQQQQQQAEQQATPLAVFKHPLYSLLGSSEEGKHFQVLRDRDPLIRATHLFSLGTHRLLIRCTGSSAALSEHSVADTQSYHRVLSQTDVVRFLHANASLPELYAITRRTVKDSGLLTTTNPAKITSTALTIPTGEIALNAFREMALRKVSAGAVVDGANRLVDTLSTSDLRGITAATLHHLQLPVSEFIRATRTHHHKDVVYCTGDDTVSGVLALSLRGGVHRVWIVNSDDDKQPIGVISLTDIIALFQA